jgi:1-aminocyclopropane-1-carboxylate deaminase/D-cysteine desulfhydrase-like pyridoxal-dependent ACC family enzyme
MVQKITKKAFYGTIDQARDLADQSENGTFFIKNGGIQVTLYDLMVILLVVKL